MRIEVDNYQNMVITAGFTIEHYAIVICFEELEVIVFLQSRVFATNLVQPGNQVADVTRRAPVAGSDFVFVAVLIFFLARHRYAFTKLKALKDSIHCRQRCGENGSDLVGRSTATL